MGYSVSRGDIVEPIIHILDGNCAHAICRYRWAYKVGTHEGVMDSRVSAVLRKRANRWYFLLMHESNKWTQPGTT